jgi:hypothetical protein
MIAINAYIMYPLMGDGRRHNFVSKGACCISDGAANVNRVGFLGSGAGPNESN